MSEINVIYEANLSVFDEVEANTNHRLEYNNGELSCVYPASAETTEYVVATFDVNGGKAELPEGTAVLEAKDSVVALVPQDPYGGGSE
jgi:hypothetical protein